MKTDLRKVFKKMLGNDHVQGHTDYSAYANSEGVFGDAEIMQMTEDGNKHQIPTYQFWNQEGRQADCHCFHSQCSS